MAGVDRGEEAASRLVSAGSHHAKSDAQLLPQFNQRAADLGGAGFDPQDGIGPRRQAAQGQEFGRRQLVEHVTDHQQADRSVRGEEPRGHVFHAHAGKGEAGRLGGIVGGHGRVIPQPQGGDVIRAEPANDAPPGHATAATPVQHGIPGRRPRGVTRPPRMGRRARRFPAALAEFAQDRIPFPADALAVGEIVAGEFPARTPIRLLGPAAGEKQAAQPVERRPVQLIPVHGVRRRRIPPQGEPRPPSCGRPGARAPQTAARWMSFNR